MELRRSSPSKKWAVFLFFSFVAGLLIRIAFPGEIEYKADERFMFFMSLPSFESWPALGMHSGVSLRNPGFSVWVFQAFSRIFSIESPVALARAVQLLNWSAYGLLLFFVLRWVEKQEREPWLWSVVLGLVNPIALIYDRKIWAQSVLPFFCVLFLIGWWRRDRRWGAFLWGVMGALLGQIHMSGFFLAGGFFFWTLFFGRKNRVVLKPRWLEWGLGSILAAVPLIPWVNHVLQGSSEPIFGRYLGRLVEPTFWRYFLGNPLGIDLGFSLSYPVFWEFLKQPWVGAAYGVVLVCSLWIVGKLLGRLCQERDPWGALFAGASGQTALAQNSALWGMAFLLMASCVPIFRHYLIVTFPLAWIWLARAALRDERWGRRALAALWVAHLLIACSFLAFIHERHGAPSGDYGVAYRWQEPGKR